MDLDKFKSNGKFLMLALDHRGSIKKLINHNNPELVGDNEVIELKAKIIKALEDQFSGVLLDVDFGLKAYPNPTKPFLLPLEKSGYTDHAGERITEIEYTPDQLISLGASGAKVLFYFNPYVKSAKEQLETAKEVVIKSKDKNFPVFLEIVTYKTDGSSYTQDYSIILDSIKLFQDNGITADVWKLEYPGSLDGCKKVSQAVGEIPWILLTNPDSYEVFTDHLKDAIQAGARGFLAGRAIWKEAASEKGLETEEFITNILPQRFKTICEIATST